MSQVRGTGTSLEIAVQNRIDRYQMRYETNVRVLPGAPDLVFRRAKVAVFLDGDFWHGYRFSTWSHTLTPHWRAKIAANRARDLRNRRRLRRAGWRVLRFWQHELKSDLDRCAQKIFAVVREARLAKPRSHL